MANWVVCSSLGWVGWATYAWRRHSSVRHNIDASSRRGKVGIGADE